MGEEVTFEVHDDVPAMLDGWVEREVRSEWANHVPEWGPQ